jgi:hypothetical protein
VLEFLNSQELTLSDQTHVPEQEKSQSEPLSIHVNVIDVTLGHLYGSEESQPVNDSSEQKLEQYNPCNVMDAINAQKPDESAIFKLEFILKG